MASLVSLSRFPRAVSFIGRRGRSASRSMSLFHPFATPGSFNPTMSRLNVGAKPKQNRLFFSSKLNNTSKNAVNKVESSAAADTGETASQETMSTWQRFLAPKPMPERQTAAWYRELLLICTVFGITGSSTMLVRSAGRSIDL